MQEEVTQRTVALCVEATKLSAGMLQQVMKKVLDEMQKGVAGHKTKLHHGKQTLRQLMKHNTGVSNIEITDQNIRAFSATAKKYGIDFALKKDTSGEIPRYLVFFKGRDADVITAAFREFSVKNLEKEKKPSIRKELEQAKQQAKAQHRQREKVKTKDRGEQLDEIVEHLTGTVIYGYLWNEARDQWLVDPEAADVVKRIFAMTIEGYGPYQIASKLKEEKILIPSAYLAQHGEGVNKNKTFKDVYGWGSSTICNILEKREYLGHTINFKTRKHFKDKKSHYVPEDEWTIFENTHEPIIDQQTFDLVQKIRGNVRRYPDGWGEAAPLTGLLYCADCGGKMYVHRTNNGKRISQYTCSQYSKVPVGKLCKTQHRINEDVVLSLVSEMLKAIAEYAKHDRAEFVRVVQEAQSSQQTTEVRKQRTRLATAKQRVSELEVLLCKIYEDNILGKLSDSRYATLDAQYEKEQSELTAEISALEKAIRSYEKHEKDADRFIALIDKYENFDKLTIAMLNEFIEKILVHERDRKGSIQTTQEVEIYFNFVGRFVPPAFGEVELTPEELEEIRKREERKDRLHQNYLKRKASGSQKRYEDKIKGRKKAEIEAKKAAIRAEDIAKGVFVPVSSLPQKEPMKGVQTA